MLLALQAVLGAGMIAMAAELGRRVGSRPAGLVFALLVAVHPELVFWTAYLMTDANYVVGLVLVLLFVAWWGQDPTAGRALAAAACLGLLNLQRDNALLLGPVLAVWALAQLGWRWGRASALAFALVPPLVMSPWLFRNLHVYGEPILVHSNTGVNLHHSNNIHLDPAETPYWWDAVRANPGPNIDELERKFRNRKGHLRSRYTYYDYSRAYLAVAVDYVLHNPLHFLRNYLVKLRNAFILVPRIPGVPVPILGSAGVHRILPFTVLAGGLAGLFASVACRRRLPLLMAAVFSYFATVRGLILSEREGRWDLPLKVLLLLFVALGAVRVVEIAWSRLALRRRSKDGGELPPASP